MCSVSWRVAHRKRLTVGPQGGDRKDMAWRTLVVVLAALASIGCECGGASGSRDGGRVVSDAGPRDAGPRDAGPVDAGRDGGGGPPSGTATTFQSVGGGTAEGSGYRVRFGIGAPQPMGTSTSADGTARTGPAATP